MKYSLFLLLALFSVSSFAQNMSSTEDWDASYRENTDGTTTYIGGCALHESYEGKMFKVAKTIIKYFEPSQFAAVEIQNKLSKADPLLLTALKEAIGDVLESADDLTLETLISLHFKGLDLYRFNVGVGGGNGIYYVFNKTVKAGKVNYELLSQVMDGDVEFCDKKVWLK